MTKEELFFKENYPEYVTEKGEYLSPYWDLFSAGVISATFELNIEKEKIKNKITEYKECCKKLAEEYRQRYNEDKTNKLALNMFYHNVIAYNNFETALATIEDRNSMMLCFSEPPILTEKTVEVDINRIAELEAQIEKMKHDVMRNVKWADQNKNGQMYCKLNAMINQWEKVK